MGTDVSVLILETLRRLGLYTHETYEPGALIPFFYNPKAGIMALVLSHQDKSSNPIILIKYRNKTKV